MFALIEPLPFLPLLRRLLFAPVAPEDGVAGTEADAREGDLDDPKSSPRNSPRNEILDTFWNTVGATDRPDLGGPLGRRIPYGETSGV